MGIEVCNRISDLPDQLVGNAETNAHHCGFELDESRPETSAPFKHILLATDFSASSTKAVQLAVDIASRCQASLTLLHVVDTNPDSASLHSGSADVLMDDAWQSAVVQMLRLKKQLREHNVQTETLIVEGIPWEQIAMQSKGFDLLVLGRIYRGPK